MNKIDNERLMRFAGKYGNDAMMDALEMLKDAKTNGFEYGNNDNDNDAIVNMINAETKKITDMQKK